MTKCSVKLLNIIATRTIKKGRKKNIKLSSRMIDHIICATEHQDNNGVIKNGLHRTDVQILTGMSPREHSFCIEKLTEYGIYVICENKDLYIPDNDFIHLYNIHKDNFVKALRYLNQSTADILSFSDVISAVTLS